MEYTLNKGIIAQEFGISSAHDVRLTAGTKIVINKLVPENYTTEFQVIDHVRDAAKYSAVTETLMKKIAK